MTGHTSSFTPAAASAEAVISVSDLGMRYGEHEALTGLSFEVFRGELFALLGPYGAGKTTTVEILEGYRRRTGGQVSVLGTDPWSAGRAWRARIGVMLQETGPEPDLTVTDCLALQGLESYRTAGQSAPPELDQAELDRAGLVIGYGRPPEHAYTTALARLCAVLGPDRRLIGPPTSPSPRRARG
ncbi:MAG TPA: ATP-binding cassette domain-containing protein [Streptosporangiaceae bacterium]